jgi:hypothetical protein
MLAAYAHPLPARRASHGFWTRVVELPMAGVEWLSRAICGLGGHSMVYKFETSRVSLRCIDCGHTTPGWTVEARGPRRVLRG